MIFVTVGTHEQQFDRLIKEVDRLVEIGAIQDKVFMQTGYCTYEPKHCQWKKFFSYDEMENYIEIAETVICHGGPATFMGVLNKDKVPIVVPRQAKYGEHVNDHQVEFAEKVKGLGYSILLAKENSIEELLIQKASTRELPKKENSTNELFIKNLEAEIRSVI